MSREQSIEHAVFPLVRQRLVREEGISATEAAECEDHFCKFASLFKGTQDKALVPSVQADLFWHTFLLFTEPYREWSASQFGDEHFLHHVPDQASGTGWTDTISLVEKKYGETWKLAATSSGTFSPDLARAFWVP